MTLISLQPGDIIFSVSSDKKYFLDEISEITGTFIKANVIAAYRDVLQSSESADYEYEEFFDMTAVFRVDAPFSKETLLACIDDFNTNYPHLLI